VVPQERVWGAAGTSETLFGWYYVCDRLISPTIFYESLVGMTVKLDEARNFNARTLNCHLPSPTDSPTATAKHWIASFTAAVCGLV